MGNDSLNIMYVLSKAMNNIFNNTSPLKKISNMHLQVFQRYSSIKLVLQIGEGKADVTYRDRS